MHLSEATKAFARFEVATRGYSQTRQAKVNRQKPVDSHGKSANENLLLTSAPEIDSLRKVQGCSQQPTFRQNPKQGFNLLLTTHHQNL
jgi:hypothetical protein